MSRIIFERLLLFALPFVLYGLYLQLLRLFPAPPATRRHPWMILSIVGLVLVVASFVLWRVTSVEPITGTYIAPHVVNGQIVPGYVKPVEKKP